MKMLRLFCEFYSVLIVKLYEVLSDWFSVGGGRCVMEFGVK